MNYDTAEDCQVIGSTVLCPNGRKVEYPCPIAETTVRKIGSIWHRDMLVLRLDPTCDRCDHRNVFSMFPSGDTYWQVPISAQTGTTAPYVRLASRDDLIVLESQDGHVVELSLRGDVVNQYSSSDGPQYVVEENQIRFLNGRSVTLDHPITRAIDYGDIVVVKVEIPYKVIYNENIFGISKTGDVLWQVPKIGYISEDSPYTGIQRLDSLLIAQNCGGFEVEIEFRTGRILKQTFTK